MISLMCYFIERDLNDEARENFRNSLNNPQVIKAVKTKTPTDKPKTPSMVPKKKWQAPEGWTPPGWNEERSYQVAKSFMGFQANPK